MSGLAIASFVQSGLELGWVPRSQTIYVGVILLAVPGVLQLLGSVLAYLARDGAAGAALGVLGTSWLALGLVDVISRRAHPTEVVGLLLLIAGVVVFLSATAIGLAKPLPGLTFAAAALRFVLAAIYQLGATGTWNGAAGILGLVVVGLAGYSVVAFELEGQERHPVLPTFRRGRGAAAVRAQAPAQVAEIGHEAGVRQTT